MTSPAHDAPNQPAPRALLYESDLFFVTKVVATLRGAGYEVETARDLAAFTRLLATCMPTVALVNLAARAVEWRAAIAAANAARVPIIAYGPHVDLEAHEAARQAGADRVIANSKLASDLPAVIARTLLAREVRHNAPAPAGNPTEIQANSPTTPGGHTS